MNTITVKDAAQMLDMAQDSVREGVLEGTLPGTVIHLSESRTRFVIPKAALDLFLYTGIPPAVLAQSIMNAETPEQGAAYFKAFLEGMTTA